MIKMFKKILGQGKVEQMSINLPFGIGGVTIKLSEAQKRAAWSLYVEYSTRITTQPLDSTQGSIREALNSMYKMFDVTRDVLKSAGPGVAKDKDSLGPLAIKIINQGVRPFIVKWHTILGTFEDQERAEQRDTLAAGVDAIIDESKWNQSEAFYDELKVLQGELSEYINGLGQIAGIISNENKEVS